MTYTDEEKRKIIELTIRKAEIAGSQAKYAAKLKISSSQLNHAINGHWEKISNEMWKTLAYGATYNVGGWRTAETGNYLLVTGYLHDAKTYGEVYAFINKAGSGKTYTIRLFVSEYSNCAHLECEEHWSKKDFLRRLYQQFGGKVDKKTVGELMDAIEEAIRACPTPPLIVLDEFDKVRDELLYFFISLYNRLNGKVGIVITSTEYLEERLKNGLQRKTKGYEEFYSRIGGKFLKGLPVSSTDVAKICRANGLEDEKLIEDVIKTCNLDLRRVNALITTKLRAQKALGVSPFSREVTEAVIRINEEQAKLTK